MAAARNNLSRRAVLGAAFAVPAALAPTEPARAPDRRRWDRALAALRRAEAEADSFRTRRMRPAERAYRAVRARWPWDYDFTADSDAHAMLVAARAVHEPVEERLNDLADAATAAMLRLLAIPAPDLPALATKIALAVDHAVAELDSGDRCLALLKADGLRLSR